jgi:predicted kinase
MIQYLNDLMSQCCRVSSPPRGADCSGMRQYATSSYMRKWMSERLKRRKKTGDGSAKSASKAPEPLQPRFYDNEPVAPAETLAEAPVESHRPSRPETEPEPAPAMAPEAATPAAEPGARTQRRRRGRGGRGRGRRKATAPGAASVAVPGDTAEPLAEEPEATEAVVGAQAPVEAAPALRARPAPAQIKTAPATPAPAVAARASKGTVVLAIGLPGSGKSSWFKRHNIHPLSSDLLRELLFDDAQEQRFQDLVFSNLRSMLKARLIARRPMNYVDATNLTPHDRHSWIKLAKDYGYDVQGLFFDVPVEVCMERHQRRGRVVPEDIMRKMAGKLKPPAFEEGFSKITVVRVKQKEATG